MLHFVSSIVVNVNGTVEDLRAAMTEKTFLGKEKFVFLTSKLEAVNPLKEVDVKVKEIFKKTIRTKVLHGTGKFWLLLSMVICHMLSMVKSIYESFINGLTALSSRKYIFENVCSEASG